MNAKLLLHTIGSDALVIHCPVNCNMITLLKKCSDSFICNPVMRVHFPSTIVNLSSDITDETLHVVAGTIDGFVGYVAIPIRDIQFIDAFADQAQLNIPFTSIDEILSTCAVKVLDKKAIVQLYRSENRCKIESICIIPGSKYIFIGSTEECFALCNESAIWTTNSFKKVNLNICNSIATSIVCVELASSNEETNSICNLMSYICGKDFVFDSELLLFGCQDGAVYLLRLSTIVALNGGNRITLECVRRGGSTHSRVDNLVLASSAAASYLCIISPNNILLLGARMVCGLAVGDERVLPLVAPAANTTSFCFLRGLQLLVYLDGGRLHSMSLHASKFSEVMLDSDVNSLSCVGGCARSTGQFLALGTSESISLTCIDSSKLPLGEEALKSICNTTFQSGPSDVLNNFVNYEQVSGIDDSKSKKRKTRQEASVNMQNNAMAINKMIAAINEHVEQEKMYQELLSAIELETLQLTSLVNSLQNSGTSPSEKSHVSTGVHRIWGNTLNVSTEVSCGSSGQEVTVSAILTTASLSLMKALHGKMVIATVATVNQLLDQDDGGVVSFSSPLLFNVDGTRSEKSTTYICEKTIPLLNCQPSVHIVDLYVNINLVNPELLLNFSKNATSNDSTGMNLPLFGVDGKELCYCPLDCGVNIPLYHGEISLEQLSKCFSSRSYIDQMSLMSLTDASQATGHNLHVVVPHLSSKPSVKNDVISSIQTVKKNMDSLKQNSYGTAALVDTTSMIQPQFAVANNTKHESVESASCSIRSHDVGNTTAVLLNSASMSLLASIHAETRKVALHLLEMCGSQTGDTVLPASGDTLRMLREDIYSTPQDVRNIMVECSNIENLCSSSSDIPMDECDTALRSFLDEDKSVRVSSSRLVTTILELYKKLREFGV